MQKEVTSSSEVSESVIIHQLDSFGVKCNETFSDTSSDISDDKCYLMEIQQLKRQNNFLKKKLAELNKKPRGSLPASVNTRRHSSFGLEATPKLQGPSRNYIIGFIEEVVKMLENFSSLFQIELEATLTKELEKQNDAFNQLTSEKKDFLNRQLNKLMMEPQEVKYKKLLQLFEGYYKETKDKRKNLREKVELLTTEAIEMGKQMAFGLMEREKVKRSVKGSTIFGLVPPKNKYFGGQSMTSSILINKSFNTDDLGFIGCRIPLEKEKILLHLF